MELIHIQYNQMHGRIDAEEGRYPSHMPPSLHAKKVGPRRHDDEEDEQIDDVQQRRVDHPTHRHDERYQEDAHFALGRDGVASHQVDRPHGLHLKVLPREVALRKVVLVDHAVHEEHTEDGDVRPDQLQDVHHVAKVHPA